MQLKNQAIKSGDFSSIQFFAEQALVDEKFEIYIETCEFLLRNRQFKFVAQQASNLVEKVGTVMELEIAIEVCMNIHKYKNVLALIENYQTVYPDEELPLWVRRAKLSTQHIRVVAI